MTIELTSDVKANVDATGEVVSYLSSIEGKLLADATTTIENKKVMLAGGAISFYRNQNLKRAILATSNEVVVDHVSIRLTKPVIIHLDVNGILSYEGEIIGTIRSADGIHTTNGTYTYADGSIIRFYSNGKVKSGTLAASVEVPIHSKLYQLTGVIAFDTNGAVDLANTVHTKIGDQYIVGGIHYFFKTGSIVMDERGNLIKGVLSIPKILQIGGKDYTLAADTKGFFEPSGNLIQGKISDHQYSMSGEVRSFVAGTVVTDAQGRVTDGTIDDHNYLIGGRLYTFDESASVIKDSHGAVLQGKISSTSSHDYFLKGKVYSFQAEPLFHANKVVESGLLAMRITEKVVDTVSVVTNLFSFHSSKLFFNDMGALLSGDLAPPTTDTKVVNTANGVTNLFSFHSNIMFHTNGKVKSSTLAASVEMLIRSKIYQLTGVIAFDTNGAVDLANTVYTKIGDQHIVGGVPYFFKTGSIVMDESGNLIKGVLSIPKILQIGGKDYTLAADTKGFFEPSGNLIQGKISDHQYSMSGEVRSFVAGTVVTDAQGRVTDGTIDDHNYLIGGRLYTFESSSVIKDSHGAVLQGKISSTSSHDYFLKRKVYSFQAEPLFHANKVVESGLLATPTTDTKVVDTVSVVTNLFSFHSNLLFNNRGSLLVGDLATPTTDTKVVDTVSVVTNLFSFHSNIIFHTNGGVRIGILAPPTTDTKVVDTVSVVTNLFSFHSNLSFYSNGSVDRGTLATPTTETKVVNTVSGVTNLFSFHSNIIFNNRGSLLVGDLATPTTDTKVVNTVSGVTNLFSFHRKLMYYSNGSVDRGTLATPTTDTKVGVDGVTNLFSFHSNLLFYSDGSVRGGALATPTTDTKVVVGGVTNLFSFHKVIVFYKNGSFSSGTLATPTTNTKVVNPVSGVTNFFRFIPISFSPLKDGYGKVY